MAFDDVVYEMDKHTVEKLNEMTGSVDTVLNREPVSQEVAVSASDRCNTENSGTELSDAQRDRIERQRRQAQAKAKARLARRNAPKSLDTGGGFLLEEVPAAPAAAAPPPAPVLLPAEQPRCRRCGTCFPQSFLYDNFGYEACDPCRGERADRDDDHDHDRDRDDDGEDDLALVARTDAKKEFLLQDCDLDARQPALRSLRRRNPHAPRTHMRLYLRAQLRERAHVVWGGATGLRAERARREEARARAAATTRARSLAALRRAARPPPPRSVHEHRWAPETHDAAADMYSRACRDCPHVETYEKM